MKKLFLLLSLLSATCAAFSQNTDNKLWYNKPAKIWTEALPVGNGRLGAVIFGRADDELLQLNEATLWSGGPVKKNVNPEAFQYLTQVREALFKADYNKAQELLKKIQGVYSESYMPLADLHIKQDFEGAAPANYYRDLNIANAVSTTSFTVKGVTFKREIFASAPDQVIIVHFTSNKPKGLNITIGASSQLHYKNEILGNEVLALKGKAPAHVDPNYVDNHREPVIYSADPCYGMPFELLVKAKSKDGSITADTSGISIKNASEITLYLSAATGFNGFDKCPDKDPQQEALNYLNLAVKKAYPALLATHFADYRHYFNRVSLSLNENLGSKNSMPTDARLEAYNKPGGQDPGLEALYFQYGRYLLISSSRTPNVPANLQGIWNKELRAPWSSNYTSNINVQMNYWLAESCNLSEMHTPLFGLIKALSVTGKDAAIDFYHAPGWVTHHNTDIWALANPVGDLGNGDPKWANWGMGGQWLSRHLWEHYAYTGDKQFLRNTAYPLMKGAAIFTLNWLVADSAGHLVTAPSMSPENDFIYADKKVGSVSISTTMDMGIIRDLFDKMIEASEILAVDASFRDTLLTARNKLIPYQIGSKGQLQEWFKDWESPDPHHRHVSHLYSVYPANEISVSKTPQLAQAAKKSLELRGDEATGWSLAWKVNLWARLRDGNHAYKLYRHLLRLTREDKTDYSEGGGLYPNMLDAHPPFQIDGNFGGAAGMAEMLMQSQDNDIHLLPAIPDVWKSGSVKGLVARGGFVVDIDWQNSKVKNATVLSKIGGICKIVSADPFLVKELNITAKKSGELYEASFSTEKGKVYSLISR
jgi:alpha-L-fucosidase 2